MKIKDMIYSMKVLGIGEVHDDETTEKIALIYLNLAHNQLYRETANLNDDVLEEETITSVANQSYFNLSRKPFLISELYRQGYDYELEGLSSRDFRKYKRINRTYGNPIIYNRKGRTINFFPIISDVPYTFDILFAPEITPLAMNTEEDDIPYPIEYHGVLVDGALYYLFQDESGFKNISKENESLKRWDKGRMDLVSYFYGYNKQKISTFEIS